MTNESNRVPFSQIQSSAERNHAEYVEGESLVEMVHEDLTARRISIDGCRDIIQYLRDQDAQTSHKLERILAERGRRCSESRDQYAKPGSESNYR